MAERLGPVEHPDDPGGAPDVGAHYRASRLRLSSLVTAAGPAGSVRAVPACPGWSVADVLRHLVGTVEDALAGRIAGPPSPAQTADQVARHRDQPLERLVARWADLAPPFEAAISVGGIVPAFLDVLSHEHDVRAALGTPGDRDDDAVRFAAASLAVLNDVPVRIDVVASPTRVSHDGETWVLQATAFEVLRFRLGRRTRRQVTELCWSADPDPIVDRVVVFGPATDPLVE